MKKRILLLSFTLLLILTVGCGKEDLKETTEDVERIEEIELVEDVENTEEIEVVELDEIDMKNKTTRVKTEELGDFTSIRKMDDVNISSETTRIKITITDYELKEVEPYDEYKEYFADFGIVDLEEIAILNITCKFENISNDILELDSLQGMLKTDTGEEVALILDFYEEEWRGKINFTEKEVKKASVTAILNSKAEEIENVELIYDDSIVLEVDLK